MSRLARFAACLLLGAVAAGMACTPLRTESADLKVLAVPLNIDLQSLSVSGMSAGGFMAQQFHMAYPEWVIGAGIIAGGPSGCAQHGSHFVPPSMAVVNSIFWGVYYCTAYAEKALDAYKQYWPAGIQNWTEFFTHSSYLLSDEPFDRNGRRCPTSRYNLRVPLDELDNETVLYDPRDAAIAACPEPTCSLDAGQEVKYRNNPHDFACLLANATLYDHEHRYLSDNIKKAKIFILRGSHDAKLPLRISDALYEYYRILGVPAENIVYRRNDLPVRHALPLNDLYKFWEQVSGEEDATVLREHINRCNEPVDLNLDTYNDSCSCSTLSTMAASVCANGGQEFCDWNKEFMGKYCTLPGDDAGSDVAGALLKQIYVGNELCGSDACSSPWQERKPLIARGSLSLKDMLEALENKVTAFDQRPFLPDENYSMSSLSDNGFVYIPEQCADGTTQCRLHVAFPGCMQGDVQSNPFVVGRPAETRKNFAAHTGFNEWANANNIIVLYPQVRTSMPSPVDPLAAVNAYACYNVWGYDNPRDPNYNYRSGKQMKAVARMINALLKQDMLPIGDQR